MVHAQVTIPALRNRESKSMNISRADLYRLIIEEYVKEEGIDLSEDKADDLLAWIKGGEKPEYLDEDHCDNIWNMSTEVISAIFLIHISRHDFVYHIVYSHKLKIIYAYISIG